MRRTFLLFFITHALFAWDTPLLRENKQNIIDEQKKEIEANAEKVKYEWLSPLNLFGSYSKSNTQSDAVLDTSISINQDLFRSGGILYKMQYAQSKMYNSLATLAQENTALYETLFVGLLNLKRLHLLLEQTHYSFLNSEIEVFLKTQQYKAGDVDITELNRALREKNIVLKTELAAKQAILTKEIELQKLTPIKLDTITIPHFELISQDDYESSSYNLLVANLTTEQSDEAFKMTRSTYLPRLSFNGAYGYQDNPNTHVNGDYYQVGASLSMALDYNSYATLQESKAAYLKNRLKIQDTKIDLQASYKAALSKIENYKEYNRVTKENITLYSNLIKVIEQALVSGLKTGYDLKTLQNTKMVDELEIEINKINIQIELAQLLFATQKGENYYE